MPVHRGGEGIVSGEHTVSHDAGQPQWLLSVQESRAVGPEDSGHNPLVLRVKGIHEETWRSYGSRRMAKQLQEAGHRVGRYQARSLMCKSGVEFKTERRFKVTTQCRARHQRL